MKKEKQFFYNVLLLITTEAQSHGDIFRQSNVETIDWIYNT